MTFRVQDDGRGLRATTAAAGLGLGLGVMARLAQHFATSARAEGGTTVQLTFPVAAAPAAARATMNHGSR